MDIGITVGPTAKVHGRYFRRAAGVCQWRKEKHPREIPSRILCLGSTQPEDLTGMTRRMTLVQEAFQRSHGTYGYRRITLWLRSQKSLRINGKAVLRLMKKLGNPPAELAGAGCIGNWSRCQQSIPIRIG